MKYFNIIFLLLVFCSCKNYHPYSNLKERNDSMKKVKSYLNPSTTEIKFLRKHDTILFDLNSSVNKMIKPLLINRRLDSLIEKNYTEKEFLILSRFDREFPDRLPVELVKDNKSKALKLTDIEEAIDLMRNMDSIISASL